MHVYLKPQMKNLKVMVLASDMVDRLKRTFAGIDYQSR